MVASWALFLWGRWLARRRGGPWWPRLAAMPLFGAGLAVVGIIVYVTIVARTFRAVAAADPAEKATLLAATISEAMNCSALFAIPSLLLYVASIIVFTVGSVLRPRAT
jgi:hypothetical protein